LATLIGDGVDGVDAAPTMVRGDGVSGGSTIAVG
jgi:hypothetical protein